MFLLPKLKDFPAHEPVLWPDAPVKEEESISISFIKILCVTAAWEKDISATSKIQTRVQHKMIRLETDKRVEECCRTKLLAGHKESFHTNRGNESV